MIRKSYLLTCLLAFIAFAGGVFAQEADKSKTDDTSITVEIVTVGTRVKGRTATETTVPIDVIGAEALANTGYADLGEVLQLVAPSFNFSRTQISDGSDLFRPATLRGLQPDQVLVLINGKRRHTQALLALANTIGEGAAGTDMNAIPISAVKSIEVLRDGAAAQYGSDAIAGVININLKTGADSGQINLSSGGYYEGDGKAWNLSGSKGFSVGDDGYLNLAVEYREGDTTNRADGSPFAGGAVRFQAGEADKEFFSAFYNFSNPMGENNEFYSFGGISERDALGAGFYRRADQADRAVPQVYPNGFLPRIGNNAQDLSLAAGFRHSFESGWSMDASVIYGQNKYSFNSINTINASIAGEYLANNPGASVADVAANAGPTEGFSGEIQFDQTTYNFDFRGILDLGWYDNVYAAFGLEYRDEGYELTPGDLASYSCGASSDQLIAIPSSSDPGTFANCGFQAFPGLRPETATSTGRDSYAIYADFESNLTEKFLLGFAVRFEDYGDIGNDVTGKLTFRAEVSDKFSLRGAVATGFRAPSLQQMSYSAVTTNLGGGGLTQSLLSPVGSALPVALGIDQLDLESSQSLSAGFVFQATDKTLITLDTFKVEIDDRIILGGFLTEDSLRGAGQDAAADALAASGVGQANFFSNGINTETTGVELVIDYQGQALGGNLGITLAASMNKNDVKSVNTPTGIDESVILTSPSQTGIEKGQPRQRGTLTFNLDKGKFGFLTRFNYFGETEESWFTAIGNGIPAQVATLMQVDTSPTHKISAAVLMDIQFKMEFSEKFRVSLGANNVLDKTPDELAENDFQRAITEPFPNVFITGEDQTFGGFRYPLRAVPYGFSGGYYFLKAAYQF